MAGAQRSHQATPAVFKDKAVTGCLFALSHPVCWDGDDGGKVTPHGGLPQRVFPLIWAKSSIET